MVVAGEKVRGGAADRVNIGIGVERDVVGNEEDSVSATNYSLLVRGIGKQNEAELLFRKWQVIAGIINARLDQETSPGQALPRSHCSPSPTIGRLRVEVGHLIEALRPWSLQFIAQTKIQSQFAGYTPVVTEVEGAVSLFADTGPEITSHPVVWLPKAEPWPLL